MPPPLHPTREFFVRLLEFVATDDARILSMRYLHEVLGRLQAAAARIPAVAPDSETAHGVEVRLELSATLKLREKLPINAYSVVFDPLESDGEFYMYFVDSVTPGQYTMTVSGFGWTEGLGSVVVSRAGDVVLRYIHGNELGLPGN